MLPPLSFLTPTRSLFQGKNKASSTLLNGFEPSLIFLMRASPVLKSNKKISFDFISTTVRLSRSCEQVFKTKLLSPFYKTCTCLPRQPPEPWVKYPVSYFEIEIFLLWFSVSKVSCVVSGISMSPCGIHQPTPGISPTAPSLAWQWLLAAPRAIPANIGKDKGRQGQHSADRHLQDIGAKIEKRIKKKLFISDTQAWILRCIIY